MGKRPLLDSVELDALFGKFIVVAEVQVDAPPWAAWDVVTNVERIGEFSPECVKVNWLDDCTGPVVGARFAGTNRMTLERLPAWRRQGLPDDWSLEWTLPCEVLRAERPRIFAYVVGDRFDGSPSSEWTFEFSAVDGGTFLRESMRHLPGGRSANRTQAEEHPERAAQIIEDRSAVLKADLEQTLQAMRATIEREATTGC